MLSNPAKGKTKMKTRNLMAVALCAAACVTTAAFAEEDFGIESASPVTIADPVNPQQGLKADAYNFDYGRNNQKYHQLTSSLDALRKMPAVRTYIDKCDSFSRATIPEGINCHTVKWEGYLKCKRAATYTFSLNNHDSYSFYVNGRRHIDFCFNQETRDVDLNVGWNHVVIIAYLDGRNSKLTMNYRPKGSVSEPRPITPKDLFHDQKPEEDW